MDYKVYIDISKQADAIKWCVEHLPIEEWVCSTPIAVEDGILQVIVPFYFETKEQLVMFKLACL